MTQEDISVKQENCCSDKTQEAVKVNCLNCNLAGKKINILTVKALLKEGEILKLQPQAQYYYCSNPACETIYFNDGNSVFLKDSIKTIIGIKGDTEGYICYCFGYKASDLLKNPELEQTIRQQVKRDNCACEVKNIHGTCCLGDVLKVLREQKNEK